MSVPNYTKEELEEQVKKSLNLVAKYAELCIKQAKDLQESTELLRIGSELMKELSKDNERLKEQLNMKEEAHDQVH